MPRILVPALLILASCKSTHEAPPPAPEERKVEVVHMWNTPDGAILTERAHEPASVTPGEPQEVVITAVGSPHASDAPSVELRPGPIGPPEVERGRVVSVDWRGDGLLDGEVLDVRGNWVKLRFMKIEKGPDPNTTIGAAVVAWVDFSRVGYYIPHKGKAKAKRGAAPELPPQPRGEIQ